MRRWVWGRNSDLAIGDQLGMGKGILVCAQAIFDCQLDAYALPYC